VTSYPRAITSPRVSGDGGCFVHGVGSILGAFRGDDMLLHRGKGRVDAHTREGFTRQVIGTGIRHDFRRPLQGSSTNAIRDIARSVIQATTPAPLMTRFGCPRGTLLTARVAVELTAKVGLTNVEARPAAPAANTHKDQDHIHAHTATAALKNLPACAPSGTLACVCAHARHEGSGVSSLGLHLSRLPPSLHPLASRRQFATEHLPANHDAQIPPDPGGR